jgi:hypothetical protein
VVAIQLVHRVISKRLKQLASHSGAASGGGPYRFQSRSKRCPARPDDEEAKR